MRMLIATCLMRDSVEVGRSAFPAGQFDLCREGWDLNEPAGPKEIQTCPRHQFLPSSQFCQDILAPSVDVDIVEKIQG